MGTRGLGPDGLRLLIQSKREARRFKSRTRCDPDFHFNF